MAVRREQVDLILEDRFSAPMARAAASAAVLDKELDHLDRSTTKVDRSNRKVESSTNDVGTSARKAGSDIDRLSGRIGILANVAGALGPGLIPIGAVAVPAVSGLASQLGFAAVAAGTFGVAFQGMGEVLKVVNKARLEPTTANLQAAHDAMATLSPEARGFVRELQRMIPELKHIRDTTAAGLFPGLKAGLIDMETALPRVEAVFAAIGTELGHISRDAGASVASGRWNDFLDFVGTEGPAALDAMATAAGNTIHALAGLWMSTTPLNTGFSDWLIRATADFDKWANELGQTQGFEDFVAYVRENGPQVADTMGAIGDAVLQIVEAAAPLGGPTLRVIETLANVVSMIADSDLGTPIFTLVSAMSALNLATRMYGKLIPTGPIAQTRQFTQDLRTMAETGIVAWGRTTAEAEKYAAASGRVRTQVRGFGRSAALVGGLALAGSGLADKMGLANTTSLALAGSLAGPWGAAVGGAVGALVDAKSVADEFGGALDRINKAAGIGDIDTLTAELAKANGQLDDLQHSTGALDRLGDWVKNVLGGNWAEKANAIPIAGPYISSIAGAETATDRARHSIEAAKDALVLARIEASRKFAINGLDATAAGLDVATASADSFTAALQRANDALKGRSAARDYQAALDAATASLKENGKNLDINTEKGRKNQAALDDIAATAHALSAQIQDPVMRAKFLDNARAEFVKTAVAMGMPIRAARELARRVGLLNTVKGVPKVDLDPTQAYKKANAVLDYINGLTAVIPVHAKASNDLKGLLTNGQKGFPNQTPQSAKPKKGTKGGSADGSTVPGPRFPYGDKVLMPVAPGEEIISNRHGQADRNRSLLKFINAGGMADGGTVGGLSGFISNTLHLDLPNTIREWNKALKASTRVIDKEKQKRDDLISKRDDLIASLTQAFRTDLFARPDSGSSSVWLSTADRNRAGVGDVFSTLRGDIRNATAFSAALSTLRKKGVDGGAYAAVAGSGNLQEAQALAALNRKQLETYETLFRRRERVTSSLGEQAGQAAYGNQIRQQTHHLAQLRAEMRQLNQHVKKLEKLSETAPERTGSAVGKTINRTAPRGPKP